MDIFAGKCLYLKDNLSEKMDITPGEFDRKIEECRREAESTRTYLKSHRVYGQKIKKSFH
jgi:hypothetical protein